MISSNATEVTIDYFLATLRKQNLDIIPAKFMSDNDKAQLNAIRHCYPELQLFLCWWHVLHAWQEHFVTNHFPELWDLLKGWVRLKETTEFDEQWVQIKKLAPPSLIQYFEDHWIPIWPMWSARARKGRTIFEFSETNMLIEAYVFHIYLRELC